MRHLLTAALGAIHIAYADGSVPSAPLNVALDVLGPDALAVAWEPPATDGGSPVSAYLVEWDPDPGMREVQVVQTSANTGANEVQTVQTYAKHVKEIQRVTTSATAVAEVQTITTSAAPGETLGGVFTIQLDTTKSGGSVQRSGVIGFNAPASGDRSGVLEILNAMSNIGPTGVQSVQKSMADAQGGITWTIMFSTAMGDVPQLTLSSNFLTGSGANVVINTPKQGNVIDGGTFTLRFMGSTTKDLAPDISDAGMQKTLEDLASIESVDVTRGGPDAQHGYYWDITFTGEFNSGDLPLMTVPSKSLKATGANAVVTERMAGNQLKGSFQLSYKLAPTGDLPFDCSAATMKSELEKLGTVGTLDVVRTEKPDLQGGYTWTISFLTLKGSLDQLGTDILKLGETRTDGAGPSMGVRVVRTRLGTVQEVQQIQVTTTNSNVKKTASFQLQTTFAGQTLATNPIFANPMDNGACMPTQAEVQKIAVTTVDTTATGGDAIVSKQAAIQLVYTSNTEGDAVSKTGPIYLDKAGDGDCAKGATTIAAELNKLPRIIGPVTVSSSALLATHECTWQVTFTNQPGNVVQLKAIPTSSGATASDTVNIGDDTITLTTVTDGTINMIKTELERLADVAQVTVTATTGLKQTCTWRVTFDGNAGNLPLMTVSTNNGVSYGATGTVSGDTITIVAGTDGTSTVLGGVFALEFEGQRTGYMPFDTSEAVMQTQLETLSTIGSVAVTRSGADPNNGYAWMVSFLNNLGNLQPLQPDALALTGTSPKIDVTEATKGALPPFNSKDPSSGLSFDSVVITDLSDLSVTAYHVDENVPFYFRVSAINAAGRGPPSYSTPQYAIPTAQVPSVPTNVSLSAVDGTTVAVYMSSPENDGGASLDSYRVEYSTSPIVDEVQQIRLVVPVTNEVQTIRITTDTVGEVQLIRLTSSYSGSPASEIQQVNCDADSSTGTFTLTFGGETTAPIPASQTDVLKIKAVLEELNAITTVTVAFYGGQTTACRPCPTSGCTSGFKVTFTSVVGNQGDMPLLTGNTFDLEGNRRLDVTESTKGQAPVSGTFKLTYLRGKDADTVALQYNAPAATVQAALVALDSSMTIVVTDGTLPPANAAKGERLWRVTFQNSGYVPDMLVRPANNLLQGNGAGILVYTRSVTPDPTVPVSVGGNRVSGYFKVKLGGHTTERISHDASDTTVKSKLEALPNVGTVSVTRSTPSLKNEYSWTVTFTANPGSFPIGAGNIDTLVADSTLLRGTNSQAAVTVVQQGSLPLDGTFKLSNAVGGVTQTTAKLSPYDTGEGIQRALETLPSIGGVSVSWQTNSDGFSWFVTFSGCRLNPAVCNIGDVNLLDKVATSLVGGLPPAVPSVTVTEVVKGVAPATTLLVTDLSGGDPFQTVISSLTYGTKYYARAYWHNSVSFGHRAVSVPEFVTTKNLPPGPPWPVTLVSSTATSITVAWEAPTVNGGATVSGYELWISEWAKSSYRKVYDRPNDAVAMQTTLQTSADNVIESGHKYSFKVRAVNFCSSENTNAACYGAFSEPVEHTVRSPVVPDPPVSLTRDSRTTINTNAANDGIVFINWTPPKDNGGSPVTSYKLFMDDGTGWAPQTLIGSFPHGYTHKVTGKTEGKVLRFYILAVNSVGPSGKSPVLALVVANVPSAPSAPSITEVSATAINVAWQPPATCTSTLTGCNGSPLLGYRLWQFAGVAASYTASGSPVNVEIQRIRTTVSAPVPEIQSVAVVGSSGKFKLYVNSQPTPLLSVSATDLEVQTAVATCGVNPTSVTHTATATGRTWAITFALADGPQALMVVVPDQLTNTVLAVAYTTSVTRVQLGTAALGGDFTVSFRGFETGHLSVTTTDKAEMKRQLENLPSVGVVDVTTTAGLNNAMTWDVTFVTELGDLPLMKVTSGRLTGGNPNVQVTTIQEGTPGRVVYDGATAPDVLSFKSTNLVSDTLYAFVVVAINAAGDGISGISTPAVAASPGAASSYTEAYGPALLQGMAGIVYEVQSVKTNGLTGSFTLQWGTSGPSSLIDTTTTASALEAMLPTTISSLGAVHVSRADLNGADCVWYVTFVSVVGDAPMLVSSDTTHVQIDEFVKGEANEFTIAPRKASGDVVTYATLPANFQGKDRFWTELWASPPSVIDGTHEFVSEGGLAVYNPVVYEIQTLRFNGVVGTFRLKLDTTNARVGGVVSTSTAPLDAAVLAAASDAKAADLIKTNLETLTNIESVLVSRVSTSGAAPWTYSVTFVTDLCDQPPLELVGDSNFMASATVLTIKELQNGVCEVQTVTTSASVESTAEVQSISTWLDATGSTIQLGGSFSLTFTGMGSITVPYNANAAAMKNLLESLNGIDDVSVTVKSANYGTPTTTGLQTWTVTFNEIMGKVPDIKLDLPTALTGSSATVLIKEVKRMGLSLGGTFVLNFMGGTTHNLPFDIEAAGLKTELQTALSTVREVDVRKEERYNGNRWTISFTKNLGDLPLLEAYPYAYEIQEIMTLGGSPTPLEGTFTLSFLTETTAPIAYDVSDVAMKLSLQALPSIGLVDVTRTDKLDPGNRFSWQVTFRSSLGNIGTLVADASGLTGSFSDVSVTELQPGNKQSLSGQFPQLAVFKKQSGLPSYTARYIPYGAADNYSVSVQQLLSGGLFALYFDNFWLQDEPAIVRVDPQLNFDWGQGAISNYGRDYISIRWFGKLSVPTTDTYVFYVSSSEGVRVWLNHQLRVDTWEDGEDEGGTLENFSESLTAGTFYDLRVEYHEATGAASFKLSWSSSFLPIAPIPTSALFHGEHIAGSPYPITVTPGATDFPYTTAFGSGLTMATAGVTAQFIIQAKDQNDNNKTIDGDAFDVEIKGTNTGTANGVQLAPFEEPKYIGQGQYLVRYLPSVSGTYTVSIQTVNGIDIYCGLGKLHKCSPFALTVRPGPATPHTSQALGNAVATTYGVLDGLIEAVAGLVSNFTIQARDTYANAADADDVFETKMVLQHDRTVQYRSNVLVAGQTGLFAVEYSIPRAGRYEIQTYLNGIPILMCPGGVTCWALNTPAILTVVHSFLHGPSCTVDDTATGALSTATSGGQTSFKIYARDTFGNLRKGDRTTHSLTTGDGRSDAFLVTFTGKDEVFRTSTAVQTLTSADKTIAGYFKLSFGKFRKQLCPLCVTALAGDVLSVSSNLVGILLPGTKFVVQECIFTAASQASTSVTVVTNHGCAAFTSQNFALQVAASGSAATDALTPLIPHDVSASGLRSILQDLHGDAKVEVSLDVGSGYQWKITFLSHLLEWSEAHLAVEYTNGFASSLYAHPLVVAYTTASGVYPVWYTPHYAGSYTVAVTTWDRDTHVKGSPFTVQVADGATHGPSTLTATGDWRTENYSVAAQQMVIEAGKPLSFQVQLKDTRRLEQQAIRLRAVVLAPVQEVQRVLVDATPFTLSFRGSPATASLTTSSSFGSIRAALEALSTISSGGVTVTPENPADMAAVVTHAFLVTFTKATGSLPLLVSPNSGATVTPSVRGAVSVRQEMQILTCTSAVAVALAGSFSVSFQGRTPVDVAASDTLATFSSTLTTLVGSSVSVVAEGGLQATVCALTTSARLFITFNQVLGDVAPLVYTKPAGSQLTVVGEDNTENTISGIYPAWGSFTLALPGRAETTVSIPFGASTTVMKNALESLSLVDQVTVTRDWFDITTETATAKLATLVQWTMKFDSHAGNMPELAADYSGISVHDDGQRKPFVETLELVRGSVGNNRSVTTSDTKVTMTTTLENPGVQEVQKLLCRGSQKFTLTYGGVSKEIEPDASLEELEKQLNAIPAGVQLYATSGGVRKSAAELSTASMFFPVCSVANPRSIEIVFKTPTDVPLIAWSLTGNDMYITEAVKGVVPSETAIKISNLEVQKLQCQVTAAAAATASFDLLYAGERITVGANAVPSALQTQLNDMKSILQVGGVDVTSTSPQVCTDPASSVDITFRKVGDQLSFVLSQIRDGILLAQVTETTKGLDSLVYDGSHQGLFNVTATPVVSGTYAMGVTVLSLSTNFCPPSFQVRPTLASGATSTHTAPAVVTQGVTEWFTLQAVDRFNNLLESSTELGTDAFVAKLLPPSVASTPAELYPVSITESNPNTNGIFSLTFLPQRAGTYTLSLVRRQAGGLWATYYATAFFTDSYLSRQDAAVSFQWGETSPLGDPFPNRNYSIRWRGELRAVVSGLHVFTLRADNAVKLVVDGLVLLDLFATPAVSSAINKFESLPIELKEGRYYSVEISYRTKDAQSFVKLEWSCQTAGLTRTAVPSASLFTSTKLVNTPFSIVAYPGVINSTQVRNSFDGLTTANASGGPIVANALDPITFVLEAHDSFGNRRFHSGSDAFEVSMVGVDGWASAGRINDVTTKSAVQYDPTFICKACAVSFVINTRTLTLNVDVASQLEAGVRFRVINANSGTSARRRDCFFTTESVSGPFAASAVAVVVASANGCAAFSSSSFDISAIVPTDWNYLGTCSVASGSTSLTACTSVFGLKRGDQLTVGREANSVHYTAGVLSTVAVPLEQPYRGALSGFVPVFKAGDTTGRHTVSMVPYVKGVYRLSVRLPAIDAVHAVITQADSALGGSLYLSVAGKKTGSLSFAALDTDVKTALEALSTVGVGNVAASLSCTNGDATKGCRWLVTFRHLTEAVSTSLGASYNGVLTGNNAAVVIQTLTQPRAAQMVNGFPKNVRVNPGVMNPTVSTAYGSGLYASTSGVLSSFFVQMKDTHGNNLESDTNYLQVQVFPAGTTYLSSQVAEVSSVAYVSEGLYNVSYMPVLSGRHTVVVTAQTSPEVHKVSSAFALPGTSRGGTFALRLFGQTTAPLVFEANATDVQQALLNLPVFAAQTMNATTAIRVTRAANNQNGFDYLITYTRLPPDLELSIVQTVNNLYSGDGGSGATLTASLQTPQSREHVKTSISLGEPIVNEQQIVTVTSTAALTGGSFQLKFGAHTTDLIPYNAPATTLEDLLNKLPSIGTNGVSVSLTTSSASVRAWTVTFLAATAGTPQTAFWNSALYTPNRIVRHARLVGDIPVLTPTSTNTLVAGVNPDGQVAVTTSVTGVSPFTTIVAHGALVPTQCTAVDGNTPFKPGSANAVGQNGLHSGRFHSRSSFVIEARDTNGNLLDGTGGGFTGAPVQELQVVETFSSAGPGNKLTGSFALVLDGQKTAALPANAGLQEVEAALEALKSLSGFVTVDTPDVQTWVATGTVIVTKTSNALTTSASFLTVPDFGVGDWIRVGFLNGPVFSIIAITATTITLSGIYQGVSDNAASVYKQSDPGAGFTYRVKFAAELGDLPALAVDTTKLGGGTGTGKAKVTACDYLRTQQLQTTAASQISGDFSLSFRGSTTPMLPWNVDASTLRSALEALDGIHAAAVSTPVTGTNGGFTWQITLVSTEPQGDNDLELLYAEGYLLLGKQARIQVTPVCPSTKTRENMNIQSVSGSEGHAFVPVLRGASTVVADVRYLGGAAYQAVYDTPREATYSLDVRYVSPRGLMGSYFDNRWLYGTPTFERVDPLIDFMWKEDRITPTSREHVSVRWQGYIKPSFSEDYVFFVLVNDGARLWIENQLVIDQYDFDVDASTAVEFPANASVALIKDRLTGITLEYRENSGVASVSLLWQSHTQPKRIVPSARLFHRSDAIMKSPFSVKTQGSKPSPPLNISLTISAADALTVHFSAPDDDGGAPVTGYQVEWWTYAAYGSNEVQVLKIATSNTGGTFTLTLDNGQTTGPLPASALYSDVELALEALDGAGDVTVIPAPSANSRDYTITFNSRVGSVPDIQVDATQLTGNKAYMVCSKGATQTLANGMQCIASESITSTVHLLSNPVTFTPPDVPKRGDPYTFVISGLTQPAASVEPKAPGEVGGTNGPGFSIRVLAKNSAGYGLPSATASMKPMASPAASTNVELRLVAGLSTSLRLWWDAPTTNNGAIVTYYVVEWRPDPPGRLSSDPFSSFREKPGFFLAAHPTSLRFKYTVDNLVPGAAYVVQVRAENVMGVGPIGQTVPSFEVPRSKAAPLLDGTGGGVALSVRPASSSIPTAASCTSLLLSWLPVTAADAHGAAVTSYVVDWYQPQSVDTSPFEVQILQIFGKDAADVVTGTFRVQYSGTYTEPLPVDVSEYELEESLEALPALRSVEVERTPFTSRGGYQWAVTFLSEAPAILGKVLSIDSTKLTATILTTNVGAQLAAPVGSSSITVAAIQGSNQVTSTDTAATGALADMYISTSQGLWRVTAVSVVTGTATLTLSGSFYGANGNYPAQLGWTVPGVLPADYHSKTIPASNATDTYSLVLDTLPPGTPYSARLSACNSLGCNAPTMASPLTLAAPKQKPATPLDVALFADSGSTLRVRWRHPPSDGGNVITHYRIEWDPKPTFDSGADANGESSKGSSFGYERKAVVNPGVDCLLTPCEAVIGSLERGAPYYVRVYAYNSFGYSIDAGYPVVPGFGVPKTLPEAPVDILLTPMQSSPDRGLTVSFNTSSDSFDDGGDDVTQYQIEWDAMDLDALIPDIVTAISSAKTAATISTGLINRVFFAEHTTQLLLLSATAYDVRGSFRLAFQDAVTAGLPWDITSDALAAALETLPTVGRVNIRRVATGFGFAWFVTFLTTPFRADTSTGDVYGDIPLLKVSTDSTQLLSDFSTSQAATSTLTGTGAKLATATLIRAFNGFEQQMVKISTSAGALGGFFRLSYNQQQTASMPANASAMAVKQALTQITDPNELVGDVDVYKRQSATPTGFVYTIVYKSRLGPNRPLVGCIDKDLTSSVTTATKSCDTTRTQLGGLPAMNSDLYGVAIVNKTDLSVRDDGMAHYDVQGLRRGVGYHVRVSAWNGVGNVFGSTRASTPARFIVQSVPDAPRDVSVEPRSPTKLLVSWTKPLNTGGTIVSNYTVQIAARRGVAEQQLIKADSSLGDLSQRRLVLQLRVGDVSGSTTVLGNVSSDGLRSALANALNVPGAIAHVSRNSVGIFSGYGYEWVVTFSDSIGDVSLIEVTEASYESSETSPDYLSALALSVTELVKGSVDGSSMNGAAVTTVVVTPQHEVQRVFIYSGSPVDLGGTVMLSVGGESTAALAVDTTSEDVRVALEGLSTVGQVSVTVTGEVTQRATFPAVRYGVYWDVTFSSTTDDLPLLGVRTDTTLPFTPSACGGTLSGVTPCVEALTLKQGGLPTQTTLSQLTTTSNYVVRLTASNEQFTSKFVTVPGAFQPVARPPLEVQNAQVAFVAVDTLDVMWQAPLDDGGARVVHYKVQWDVSANFDLQSIFSGSDIVLVKKSDDEIFDYRITGLSASKDYFVSVVAYNARGHGVPVTALPVDAHERVTHLTVSGATLDEVALATETMTLSFANYPSKTATVGVAYSALELQSALQRLSVVGVLSVKRSDYSKGPAATPYDTSGVDTPSNLLMTWSITFLTASVDGVRASALGALTVAHTGPSIVAPMEVVSPIEDDSLTIRPRAVAATGPRGVRVSIVDTASLGVSWLPSLSPLSSKYLVEWSTTPDFAACRAGSISSSGTRTNYATAAANSQVINALPIGADGRVSYTIISLPANTKQYVRVSAYNGNYGSPALAQVMSVSTPNTAEDAAVVTVLPGVKSLMPRAVTPFRPTSVTMQVSSQDQPTQIEVSFVPPTKDALDFTAGNGGATITHYRLSWWDPAALTTNAKAVMSYDARMVDPTGAALTCYPGPCLFRLGAEVQSLSLTPGTGSFRLVLSSSSFTTSICTSCLLSFTAPLGGVITMDYTGTTPDLQTVLGTNARFVVVKPGASCVFEVAGAEHASSQQVTDPVRVFCGWLGDLSSAFNARDVHNFRGAYDGVHPRVYECCGSGDCNLRFGWQ